MRMPRARQGLCKRMDRMLEQRRAGNGWQPQGDAGLSMPSSHRWGHQRCTPPASTSNNSVEHSSPSFCKAGPSSFDRSKNDFVDCFQLSLACSMDLTAVSTRSEARLSSHPRIHSHRLPYTCHAHKQFNLEAHVFQGMQLDRLDQNSMTVATARITQGGSQPWLQS